MPGVFLIRIAVGLFIAALTACFLPSGPPPSGPPPSGPTMWAAVAVGAFVLSISAAITAEARKHRFIRTGLGYWALALLIVSAAIMAAASVVFPPGTQLPVTPDAFIFAGTIALTAAGVLGTLAAFRAEGAATRFLPVTPIGWWAAAFLAVGEVLQYSPWAALSPAMAMAGPALALAAMVNYRERSVLSVIALVAGPAQLAYFYLAFLISMFTPHP